MPYHRRNRSFHPYQKDYNSGKTKVTLSWSQTLGAYNLRFSDTHHFDKMQGIFIIIKAKPREDWNYDGETKTWDIAEAHVLEIKKLIEAFSTYFDLDFQEKPESYGRQGFQHKFVSNETLFDKFLALVYDVPKHIQEMPKVTTIPVKPEPDIKDYQTAKKFYRQACLRLHPDRNPNNPEIASRMSELNEVWTSLEIQYFKVKQRPQQQQEELFV